MRDFFVKLSLCIFLFAGILNHSLCLAQEVGLDDGEHIPQYRIQLGIDGNYATGNLKQRRANGRMMLFKRWGEHLALLSTTSYQYMRNGEVLFADDFRSVLMINYLPLAQFQPFMLGLYHNSYTRFIDHRWMGGLGLAYAMVRSKDHQLKFGLGVAREWTTWENRPPPFPPSMAMIEPNCLYQGEVERKNCTRQMWRMIPRLVGHHEFGDQHVQLDYEALWVVDPLDIEDERVYASITLTIPLLSWLSIYTHYDFSIESIILDHRQQLDTHLNLGLKLNTQE